MRGKFKGPKNDTALLPAKLQEELGVVPQHKKRPPRPPTRKERRKEERLQKKRRAPPPDRLYRVASLLSKIRPA